MFAGGLLAMQARNGNYLAPRGDGIIDAATPGLGQTCQFFCAPSSRPNVVTLRAGNGLYLSRWGPYQLKAAKTVPDEFCYFRVTVAGAYEIALQPDTGRYVTLWDTSSILALKVTMDPFCVFWVTRLALP